MFWIRENYLILLNNNGFCNGYTTIGFQAVLKANNNVRKRTVVTVLQLQFELHFMANYKNIEILIFCLPGLL